MYTINSASLRTAQAKALDTLSPCDSICSLATRPGAPSRIRGVISIYGFPWWTSDRVLVHACCSRCNATCINFQTGRAKRAGTGPVRKSTALARYGPASLVPVPGPTRSHARAWAKRSARSAGPGMARSNGRHGAGTARSRRIAEAGRELLNHRAAGGSGI